MAQATIPARGTSTFHLGWLGVAVLVVIVAVVAGLVGYAISANQATTANPDQALANDSTAVWGSPYDAAKIASVYASNAVIYDTIAGETVVGLPAIQARVAGYIKDLDFKVMPVSEPIRQGENVALFVDYGTATASAGEFAHALTLMQVKDGKVQNQWIYPVR